MSSDLGEISYVYDADGRLTAKSLGDKTDSYAYDAAGQLSGYTGYDGAETTYRYDTAGLLRGKTASGGAVRLTLEELLLGKTTQESGNGAGVGETTQESGTGTASTTTTYIYDMLQENAQVLAETADGVTTRYTYGTERIAAYRESGSGSERTGYLYDVHGSVVQTLTTPAFSGEQTSRIHEGQTGLCSYRYTPYGEQILAEGEQKQSGYLYNAESYDAMTGSCYLRARFYEPAAMRFQSPDIVRGSAADPQSLNRYAYVQDNPVMYADPSGESLLPVAIATGIVLYTGVKTCVTKMAEQKLNRASQVQKTTQAVIQAVKASAGWKAIMGAIQKTPAGYALVQVGNIIVKAFTQKQAKAVAEAQEVFDALKSSDSNTIKVLNQKLLKACTEFLNGSNEQKAASLVPQKTVKTKSVYMVIEQAPVMWDYLEEFGEVALPWIIAGGTAIVAKVTGVTDAVGDTVGAFLNSIHPADPNAADKVQPEGEANPENERKKGKEKGETETGEKAPEETKPKTHQKSDDTDNVKRGTSRAPDTGEPGSIYEQLDNQGNVMSRVKYGKNGKPEYRDDLLGRPHYSKKLEQYLKEHRHRFYYNDKGQPIGEEIIPISD